jgi:predicted HD superfamily hydrolase involved in NAD metabolism
LVTLNAAKQRCLCADETSILDDSQGKWFMHTLLQRYVDGITLTGDIRKDAPRFLIHHGMDHTAKHVEDVAGAARRTALQYGVDADSAETGGWLHDISTVIPNAERIAAAEALGITVLAEETKLPMILHQKLSVAFAREIFGVTDAAILSAIGCHTTLKQGASPLDKVVFVADKVAWDQPGSAPFHPALDAALKVSLDKAALVYLCWLWEQRESLRCVHPWFVEAYEELRSTF